MAYTIKNHCAELPDMEYDDGAETLFLYTGGDPGNVPDRIVELLRYMNDTKQKNACTKRLKAIQKCVDP